MNHVKTLLLILLIIIPISAFANNAIIPLKLVKFISYYESPVTPGSPAVVQVIFYGEKPTAQQVETFLRSAITTALTMEPSTIDILATAWHGTDSKDAISDEDNELNEEELEPNLIYKASDKTIKIMG